jgi:4-amino-4-deoxy-L-arabinose transferase-like glycosyltransferase
LPLLWIAALQWIDPAQADFVQAWLQANNNMLVRPGLQGAGVLVKALVWFAWPAWPIAIWAVYAWRTQAALHIQLPVVGAVALLILCLFSTLSGNIDLLSLLPPLAILATFGLPTFKRGAINAVDWFSVMTLSAIAGFIWLGWIAKQTGWPAQLAKNAFKLAPGFQPEFNIISLLVALATTIGWLLLLRWRLARRPSVLWRAVVLSTGGVILCWLLLMTLWLPWLNYGKSYASVAEKIAEKLPENYRCVIADGVGAAQRASFAYLGPVKFGALSDTHCEYVLVQDTGLRKKGVTALKKIDGEMTLLWQGRRASDRDESFRLFQRKSP